MKIQKSNKKVCQKIKDERGRLKKYCEILGNILLWHLAHTHMRKISNVFYKHDHRNVYLCLICDHAITLSVTWPPVLTFRVYSFIFTNLRHFKLLCYLFIFTRAIFFWQWGSERYVDYVLWCEPKISCHATSFLPSIQLLLVSQGACKEEGRIWGG